MSSKCTICGGPDEPYHGYCGNCHGPSGVCKCPVMWPSPKERMEEDARCWRKLISLCRIRVMGSAGFGREGYKHLGVEFWNEHADPYRDEAVKALYELIGEKPKFCQATFGEERCVLEFDHSPSDHYGIAGTTWNEKWRKRVTPDPAV